jgi:hypothetical protein
MQHFPRTRQGFGITLGAMVLSAGLTASCGGEAPTKGDEDLAKEIAGGLVASCPAAAPNDENARVDCAAKLTGFTALRDAMIEPFLWGSQKAGASYRLNESDTTRFNALVWRRMYLSLFTFDGTYTIEHQDELTVLRLPYHFRNQLDIGSYPYPFWHSSAKWESWQYSSELILVFAGGKIRGALRSQDRDRTRPFTPHAWSGQWRWQEAGQEMPYPSLYTFLFSAQNPHVTRLDQAYRALESELRENACFVCHSPDNLGKMPQLELFNYPNHALLSRHTIVTELGRNSMPPKNDLGFPVGIADAQERQSLLEKASVFEVAGDDALAWENEIKQRLAPAPAAKP